MDISAKAKGGLVVAVLLIGCGEQDSGPFGTDPADVTQVRSALTTTATQALVITDLSVTRDPARTEDPCSTTPGDEDKVWTIGHMLKREAQKNSLTPSTYVSNWMNAWTSTVTINGQTVPPFLGPVVRDVWQKFAGGSTALPLHKAPFWMLAIASRFDLRKHRPLGEPLGGEVRFIFGILSAATTNPACPTTVGDTVSTIILEYSPAKADENQVRDFARRWLDLSNLTGAAYRSALETLTEEVINSGRLLHIRTNEGPSGGKVGGGASEWDMTEFEPNATTKFLQRSTLKQAPTMALASNDSQRMSDWIWSNRDALSANGFDFEVGRSGSRAVTALPIGDYSVPDRFPGTTIWFRGSLNFLQNAPQEFWSGPLPTGVSSAQQFDWNQARFRFSVGTCRGCHGGETGTGNLHITPVGVGIEAARSSYLSGAVDVPDPTDPSFVRSFNEMLRRENDLRDLANGAPVQAPVLGNNYTVRFRTSGKCMDSAGNTTTDGAFSQLYSCHGNANQRLSLVSAGAGVYSLKYKHSGKCIDVQNASTGSGARVVQMTCNSSRASQKLTLDVLTGTTPTLPRVLRFQHSGLCLLVQNQATADATPIIQGTCPAVDDFAKGFDLVE
jgi:hypothetical protein